jgi:hypothetical protein
MSRNATGEYNPSKRQYFTVTLSTLHSKHQYSRVLGGGTGAKVTGKLRLGLVDLCSLAREDIKVLIYGWAKT